LLPVCFRNASEMLPKCFRFLLCGSACEWISRGARCRRRSLNSCEFSDGGCGKLNCQRTNCGGMWTPAREPRRDSPTRLPRAAGFAVLLGSIVSSVHKMSIGVGDFFEKVSGSRFGGAEEGKASRRKVGNARGWRGFPCRTPQIPQKQGTNRGDLRRNRWALGRPGLLRLAALK
jgi:hypothetical protein